MGSTDVISSNCGLTSGNSKDKSTIIELTKTVYLLTNIDMYNFAMLVLIALQGLDGHLMSYIPSLIHEL